jgi:cytochrome c biogenesis protein CcmG, thiol:disulfide interchange protein DsbE
MRKNRGFQRLKWILGPAVIIAVVVGVWSYARSRGKPETSGPAASSPEEFSATRPKKAPSFELEDSSGRSVKLEELRGNVVLVHFWASWCPPCLDELPAFIDLANDFKGRAVRLVAVTLDEKWEDAQKILSSKSLPPNALSLMDQEGKTADQFGSFQFPESYLLTPDLEIVAKWVGPQDWKSAEVRRRIEAAFQRR